jgi:hypothetical protein
MVASGIDHFFLVEKVYHYNSTSGDILTISPGTIQVPEFEIRNINLLIGLDYNIINKYCIPLIELVEDKFYTINLKYYEEVINNLQP